MPKEKVPAFQFYPKDFLTDEKVVLMSNTEVGLYVRLLCYCWLEGTLPIETEALCRMAQVPLKQFTKLWENTPVRQCFQIGDDGRLHHKRLDEEREKQADYRRRQSDAGRASATKRQPDVNQTPTTVQAVVQPESKSPISDLLPAFPSPISKPEHRGGSKRPIYQSDRFVVFEWQLDEISKTLGSHVDDFDLHGFFDDLSRQSRNSGLVIPSDRDARWKWLQAQVEAEAARRGLPMATVPHVGKSTTRLAAALANIRAQESL